MYAVSEECMAQTCCDCFRILALIINHLSNQPILRFSYCDLALVFSVLDYFAVLIVV